jgi:hypothetical protein
MGGVEHRLAVYMDAGQTRLVMRTEWSVATEASVRGLADSSRYWLVVEGRDAFGNPGASSPSIGTTMDASPPVIEVDVRRVFGPSGGTVEASCTDAASGVGSVEWSMDGGVVWAPMQRDGDEWTVVLSQLPSSATEGLLRATDNVGNALPSPIRVPVDTRPPTVSIASPSEGSIASGPVVIVGSINDAHLSRYAVESMREGETSWSQVQPAQETTGLTGVLAVWSTSGLPDGTYFLRVNATDVLGQSTQAMRSVTIKGAHLAIGTADLTFSDPQPLPGSKVTVMVTVRNDGDTAAENVDVVVFDHGKEVGRQTGATVPAHGVLVVPVVTKAMGDLLITARASSPLYDTGEMPNGQPLRISERPLLGDSGGLLALIALMLALVALLLIIRMMFQGGSSRKDTGAEAPVDGLKPALGQPK